MLHPGFAASHSPPAGRSLTPRSDPALATSSVRRNLPDRNVCSSTIEEAYVDFILCCNPGVPSDVSTSVLRDAFQTPPKSGGKTFSTFTLFELIAQLESKELKTWAELALKLGVEPPDTEKGESSQKIQQYAVRLKRWMHSMHVDAFFDYLLDRPSTYWTELPSDSDPINESERDGVAAEDDMALRALMPQLKPRRGKRRLGDDDNTKSPMVDDLSARPENGTAAGPGHGAGPDLWSAQTDGRTNTYFFPSSAITPSTAQPSGVSWTNTDIVQTPLTAYPHSAITPSTRNTFWVDPLEPKSAVTPTKGRNIAKRHGAKVVSSAWRSGASSTGKTRGRPPNRGSNQDGPFSAFPAESPSFKLPGSNADSNGTPHSAIPRSAVLQTATTPLSAFPLSAPPGSMSAPATPAVPPSRSVTLPSPTDNSIPPRPAKRSRLSLQVPERVGGEVRLATPPPPVVVVSGEPGTQPPNEFSNSPAPPVSAPPGMMTGAILPDGRPVSIQGMLGQSWNVRPGAAMTDHNGAHAVLSHVPLQFQDPGDRTNMDVVEVYFVHEIINGVWHDAKGNTIPPCSYEEAFAIGSTVTENILKASVSKEAFLINMAALVGGKFLHVGKRLHIVKYDEEPGRTRYTCEWELQMGDIKGNFSMQETVRHDRWQKKPPPEDSGGGDGDGAVDWQKKYLQLAEVMKSKDQQLDALRSKIMDALHDPTKQSQARS